MRNCEHSVRKCDVTLHRQIKVEPKRNEMRTQKYTQVEAIVAKYKNLASNTEAVKKTEKGFSDFFIPEDFRRLHFVEQLLGRIYLLKIGESINEAVVKEYEEYTRYYIEGLITAEEETFLVENFDVFVDYALDHLSSLMTLGFDFDEPIEWSQLVPYLLNNRSGRVFIPSSNKGREFVGLGKCDLLVGDGFANAAMRALACGHDIKKYKKPKHDCELWADLEGQSFDAIIVEMALDSSDLRDFTVEDCFNACNRIVKDGGEILLCLSKKSVLSDDTAFLRQFVSRERTLQAVVQLPSGKILFHFVKQPNNSFVMCDATSLSQRSNERVVDAMAFQKEVEMANMPERDEHPVVRRFSYEELNENILLPFYYLNYTKVGSPISEVATVESTLVLSDECQNVEKMVTVNQLSKTFSKGEFSLDSLPTLRTDRLRRLYRVEGPAVVMAVSDKEIAVGYTTDNSLFLVPKNMYVLKPANGLDVKYLASQLLNPAIQKTIVELVYGKGNAAALTHAWCELIRISMKSLEEQAKVVREVVLNDYAEQENDAAMREKGFKHSIRLRKHALSQNISAFDSLFSSLNYCMQEHKGRIQAKDQLSPVSSMTVGDAMESLKSQLKVICERVEKLSDEQDYGKCEAIEPQEFIEGYEREHHNVTFKFSHAWESFEKNSFQRDVFDKKTGKLLFHKGESMNSAWFPKKALEQVFDNIVSNALEHGFTDRNRTDYVIQSSWTTDGLNMVVRVSNNGTPMPADINTDLVMEYGYSTALNERGHGGIGGGEIAEIMRRFGGDVSVISSPGRQFTVTYVLRMPLASLY